MSDSEGEEWWYNVKQQKAERGKVSGANDRMGPYPDEATALHAFEIARERTRAADEYDDK